MAKNDINVNKIEKPMQRLNATFSNIISNLTNGTDVRDRERENLDRDINNALYGDMKNLTDLTGSGDNMSTYLMKTISEIDGTNITDPKDIDELFNNDSNGLYTFFQERYKNKMLLYDDLQTLSTQLYELKEAINTTRDAIVTSDDMSQIVSRTLVFSNTEEDTEDYAGYVGILEKMEKQFKIPQKIKEHVIPKALTYGQYYVYTVPYSVLFEQHYYRKQKMQKEHVTESSTFIQSLGQNVSPVNESFIKEELKSSIDMTGVTMDNTKTLKSINSLIENVQVYNDDIAIPVLEDGTDFETLIDFKMNKALDKRKKEELRKAMKGGISGSADGTVNVKDEKFDNVSDCYVQLIDPKKIIPVKIMDETIGYYYIHEQELETTKSPFTTTIRLSPSANTDKKQIEQTVLGKIANNIVKSFDKKYLNDNIKFRRLILSAIMHNDIYKKKLKFQFIPVDYITEFNVNEDEEGEGRSMLLPSLFYAKLYLALLIFKMITIVTRSNDTRINYIRNSGMDKGMANKVQSVARSMKEGQINFNDLLQSNTLVSKIGAAKDIYMPVGKTGERGIEFDVIAGQDVQLNTDLMEMLRAGAINATGVPSVIMNYVNEADYAKTLVMANAKFMNRVVSLQSDFNPQITELYKKIVRFSNINIPEEVLENFNYQLNPPKSLNSMNMMDIINNAEQVVNYIIKSITGENAEQSEFANKTKDELFLMLSKELLPMLPWGVAEEFFKLAQIEATRMTADKNAQESEDSDV